MKIALLTKKVKPEWLDYVKALEKNLKNEGHEFLITAAPEDVRNIEILIADYSYEKNEISQLMDRNSNLKYILSWITGVNHIDVKKADEKGIKVTSTKFNIDAVANYVNNMILSIAMDFKSYDEKTRQGEFASIRPTSTDPYGKTLGIIGLGSIGSLIAKQAEHYKMNVLAIRRRPELGKNGLGSHVTLLGGDHPKKEWAGADYRNALDYLLENSDFITVNIPLIKDGSLFQTHHLIGEEEFGKMKNGVYFINASRGGVVDDGALIKAIQDRKIAGAAIDVYENSGGKEDGLFYRLSDALALAKNVWLTPHMAGTGPYCFKRRNEILMEQIKRISQGKEPIWIADPDLGY